MGLELSSMGFGVGKRFRAVGHGDHSAPLLSPSYLPAHTP